MTATPCWHCGQDASDSPFTARTPEGERPTCCAGCTAAVEMVHQLGYGDYYRLRTQAAPVADKGQQEHVLALFEMPGVVDPWFEPDGAGRTRLRLQLDGLHCAACCWLIEKVVSDLPGLHQAVVNLSNMQMTLVFDSDRPDVARQAASRILELGYDVALPGDPQREARILQEDRRMMGRLVLSGLGSMQAMMYAAFLYVDVFEWDRIYMDLFRVTSLLISIPVVFYAGWPFFRGALNSFRVRTLTMDVPVALALLLAFFGSLFNMVMGGEHVYFESAAMFVFFLLISRTLEMKQRHRIQRAWQRLQDTLPRVVRRVRDGEPSWVAVREVQPGDELWLAQGETIPVDARILDGDVEVSEAALTGESVPVHRQAGDRVEAGGRILEGRIRVEARGTVENSLVARIAEQVEQASQERVDMVRDWQKVAPLFILASLVLAGVTLWIHWDTSPTDAFENMLALLVVTCPCALALAVPLAMSASLSSGLRNGVLIASPRQLLAVNKVRGILFDKTGTLTRGMFARVDVQDLDSASVLDATQRLRIIAALEREHPHPLARAFDDLTPEPGVTDIQVGHRGAEGRLGQQQWRIGGAPEQARPGTTCLELCCDGVPSLRVWLADELRPEAARVVQSLRGQGWSVRLASGDARAPVEALAATLALDQACGEMTPVQKAEWVQTLQRQEGPQAMVGDGINDAPALLEASVSIAPGNATSLARRAAGIYLLQDSLTQLPAVVELARRTRRKVYENLYWAVGYNVVVVPMAMAGWINAWAAALGMAASSLIVTYNANRLNSWKASTF